MSQHCHQSHFRGIPCHGNFLSLDGNVSEEGMLGDSARWDDKTSTEEAADSETMVNVYNGALVCGGVQRGDAVDVP